MTEDSLRDKTVQAARAEGLAKQIAELTQLSLGAVRGRLSRAHGRTLLRNLFAEEWPQPEPRVPPNKGLARVQDGPGRGTNPGRVVASTSGRTIHRVRQEFSTSCGVAVVAMFARVSHEEAMAVLFPNRRRTYYTHLHQLKRALDHFGVSYASHWKRFVSWEEIATTSLVKVKWEDFSGRPRYHWVIFQRRANGSGSVIDPDPPREGTLRLATSERERYVAVSYLAVAARPSG